MKQHKHSELEELEEQLRRAEAALAAAEADEEWLPDEEDTFEDFDEAPLPDEEDAFDAGFDEDPSPLYRNYANGYGRRADDDEDDPSPDFDDDADYPDELPRPR